VVARVHDPPKHIAHFGLVIDQLQQGLAARPRDADPKDVLGGRIEVNDQQAAVDEDDAGAQTVEEVARRTLALPAARPSPAVFAA
jgi:hypothetical protein